MNSDYRPNLAASITWSASKQTYYTVRFLVDRARVPDAYRAYAYFRWLDDRLDRAIPDEAERLAFVERQQQLVEACFQGKWPSNLEAEERLLVDLVRGKQEKDGGLEAYIRNMLAVMVFDARRRGRLISREELDEYTRCLATAVTEALHYFIGNGCAAPRGEARYLAASGAHIAHMLRDSLEDSAAGYYNIPREFLEARAIAADDVGHPAYRAWVRSRVRKARSCLEAGKAYLARVSNLRCRIAGYAYIARFEGVLDTMEREGYQLRARYSECTRLWTGIKSAWSVLRSAFKARRSSPVLQAPFREREKGEG